MKNTDNKPCPFCGFKFFADKLQQFIVPKDASGTAIYEYRCVKCRTHFIFDKCASTKEAFERWNKRV